MRVRVSVRECEVVLWGSEDGVEGGGGEEGGGRRG